MKTKILLILAWSFGLLLQIGIIFLTFLLLRLVVPSEIALALVFIFTVMSVCNWALKDTANSTKEIMSHIRREAEKLKN